MKTAQVVVTKPASGLIEYDVIDSVTKRIISSGHQVAVDVMALSSGDRALVLASRAVLQRLAEANASAYRRIGTVVVVTTRPVIGEAEYGVQDGDGNWLHHGVPIPTEIEDLAPADLAAIVGAKTVMQALATSDATVKGLLT